MSEADLITSDLPCISCGYNLRTLARSARCPECGNPVLLSSDNAYTRWGREYAEQLASGLRVAGILNLVAPVIGIFGGFAARDIGFLFALVITLTIHVLNSFLLTIPRAGQRLTVRARVLRIAGCGILASLLLVLAVLALGNVIDTEPLSFLSAGLGTVSLSLYVYHFGTLAAEIAREADLLRTSLVCRIATIVLSATIAAFGGTVLSTVFLLPFIDSVLLDLLVFLMFIPLLAAYLTASLSLLSIAGILRRRIPRQFGPLPPAPPPP